ncbi:MAG: argininosuccinate lyase, partial [Bacteroidales bacterium]|nr:argininosuccinate lyase [Bacteroidales bacterium]
SVAETIGRLAFDGCLYSSQNFGFVKLPDALTTGSSIMPHKKNPDVFELVRARCNKICGAPNDIRLITGNLPSGYFRDMQILKEVFFPIFDELDSCLDIVEYAVKGMEVKTDVMSDPKYTLAFSVEKVNDLVAEGVPFRDAYRQVAASIADGSFEYSGKLSHTHEGSIGNLCNDRIAARMETLVSSFGFEKVSEAVSALIS